MIDIKCLHEAAHAVVAVYLGLSFARVTKKWIFDPDASVLKPPGVWNLKGPSEDIRVVALTGCTLEVLYQWDSIVSAQLRLAKQETQYDLIQKWMTSRFGLDLTCYQDNQDVRTHGVEDADLALSEKYVRQLMSQIEQVGAALDASPLGMLTFDEVKQLCNFTPHTDEGKPL